MEPLDLWRCCIYPGYADPAHRAFTLRRIRPLPSHIVTRVQGLRVRAISRSNKKYAGFLGGLGLLIGGVLAGLIQSGVW